MPCYVRRKKNNRIGRFRTARPTFAVRIQKNPAGVLQKVASSAKIPRRAPELALIVSVSRDPTGPFWKGAQSNMNYEDLIKQAIIHFEARENLKAIDYATRAIESDPARVDGYYWRASVFHRIRALEDAQADAGALLACHPDTALHFAYRGYAHILKKEYKQAIVECSEALTRDESVKEAYFYQAWANSILKQADCAISDLSKAIVHDPKYAAAYNLCGFIYSEKDDFDRAIENFDKAIALDPDYEIACNNRLNAYLAKDKKLSMRLDQIRDNEVYMEILRKNINDVIPFLGAGVSKPYGYYTWSELLQQLLSMCCRNQDVPRETEDSINKCIKENDHIEAISKMDKFFANISAAIRILFEYATKANPIGQVRTRSSLSEYLHLFPNKNYFTTNYDTVVEDVLDHKGIRVTSFYPTSALNLPTTREETDKRAKILEDRKRISYFSLCNVYYLHGVYHAPASIVLSKIHYDDFYGQEGDITASLRRFLPQQIHSIYHNSIFLFIGCGMNVKQDRILKILREFNKILQSSSSSYTLLNVNEIADTDIPYEDWKAQSENVQERLNTALKHKEQELAEINVCVIWYSAPAGSDDRHESAKRQLFEYILGSERLRWLRTQEQRERDRIKESIQFEAQQKEQQITWLRKFDSETCVESANASETQRQQVQDFLQGKILVRTDTSEKLAIAFPMYKIGGGSYQIYLVSENGKYHLSDGGTTYAELDQVFELAESDVIKNLVAILKQYGCRKQQDTTAFVIDCSLDDIPEKMSYLIQAISFMLNMKIFYV